MSELKIWEKRFKKTIPQKHLYGRVVEILDGSGYPLSTFQVSELISEQETEIRKTLVQLRNNKIVNEMEINNVSYWFLVGADHYDFKEFAIIVI